MTKLITLENPKNDPTTAHHVHRKATITEFLSPLTQLDGFVTRAVLSHLMGSRYFKTALLALKNKYPQTLKLIRSQTSSNGIPVMWLNSI